MSAQLIATIRRALERAIVELGVDPPVAVALEVPPKPELGDLATPIAFEMAKRLKRAPRAIATALAAHVQGIEGIARVEIAGAGYLNIDFDRDLFLRELARELPAVPSGEPSRARRRQRKQAGGRKVIVEHTNINPNKAAHIGHLRNAVLGDTLVHCLESLGQRVEVQNYIDDTGVQVADLAVGFHVIRGLDLEGVTRIAERCRRHETWRDRTRHFVSTGGGGTLEVTEAEEFGPHDAFDHYCWDLYGEVAPFYAASPENAALRGVALEQMEKGHGPYAELAAFLSRQMVLHHLRTMKWIGVHYDLLPRESDILALGFWKQAFELLKKANAIRYVEEGKARGCWVMDLPDAPETPGSDDDGAPSAGEVSARAGADLAKIIVRSNGTVTYVGKDIAYQMWKFGLLGKDFHYRRIDPRELASAEGAVPAQASSPAPSQLDAGGWPSTDAVLSKVFGPGEPVWTTSPDGEEDHPAFGGGGRVYNVIDVRQSYLQKVVAQGLKALGHEREASESVHFSYEMVALTPRSVLSLNEVLPHKIPLNDEEMAKPYIEMSGRRGIGVKAEDLLRTLVNQVYDRITKERSAEITDREMREKISVQIAVGALRYYMLRFTKNRVIAFDFEDSLTFEGETGPYLQYAAVRSNNIFNKLRERDGIDRASAEGLFETVRFSCLDPPDDLEHWQIVRDISRLPEIVEQAVASLELSLLARYVFSVAQRFSAFYHRYPVLNETDPDRRKLRIALNELFLRFMETSFALMGIPLPERM